jgi:hypothetical protein
MLAGRLLCALERKATLQRIRDCEEPGVWLFPT